MAFLGPESQWAAEASECAADQDAFWLYHDKLFASQAGENQGAFNKDKLKGFAAELGLDTKAFNDCLDSGKHTQAVQTQSAAAQQLGVNGTPSFFVNDWLVQTGSLEGLEPYIEKAKQGLRPPPTPTPLPPGVEFFDLDPARPGFTYDGSPSLGAADAPLVLVSFEDFKSAAGAQYVSTVEPTLKSKYVDSGQVRRVFKFFPDTAPKAAVAALCAARQDKFWEFRNLLYTEQAQWQEGDEAAMSGYATRVGLDGAAFTDCLADKKAQSEVDASYQFGQKQIGVPTTPSFLLIKVAASGQVEDVKGFAGAQTLDVLETAIQELLQPQSLGPVPSAPISAEKLASLPVGVDADGNFYRGNPNAPIRLVDFSDFQ